LTDKITCINGKECVHKTTITRKSLEATNAPQMPIKGRSRNQTPLVHQDMTKKNTFYEK